MKNQGRSYDNIAYDFANMRVEFASEKKYLDLFIKALKPKSSILDVGCGSGIPIARYLINQGFKVTGIDGSRELLSIAQNNCPMMNTF